MPRIELEKRFPEIQPSTVITALTDFTPRRTEIWPSLSPARYEVLELGADTALVREGQESPSLWALERYEWTDDRVRWTAQESNFCAPGSFVEVKVAPGDGGGSLIRFTWDRRPTTLPARIMLGMVKLTRGKPLMSSLAKGLANASRMGTEG